MHWIKKVLFLLCCIVGVIFARTSGIAVKNLNVRKGPSIASEVIDVASSGALGTVIEKTESREIIDTSREFSYHWYKVDFDNGLSGWVFGQYFYTLQKEVGDFTLKGSSYELLIYEEDGYLNDPPYNDQYDVPVIRSSNGEAELIQFDGSFTIPPEGHRAPYFALVGNTAISESLKTVPSVSQGRLLFTISVSHQIGGGGYTLVVEYRDGQFYAVGVRGYKMRYDA